VDGGAIESCLNNLQSYNNIQNIIRYCKVVNFLSDFNRYSCLLSFKSVCTSYNIKFNDFNLPVK
jgi:hypothetical protein